MRSIGTKGAYFFVIDAFIGSIIIIAAIVIIYSGFSANRSATQSFYNAEDFMTLIETTQIRDYGYDNGTIKDLVKNGNITDTKLTILQQLTIFYAKYKYDAPYDVLYLNRTQNMSRELVNKTPENTNIAVYVKTSSGTELLASRTNGMLYVPETNASTLFSAQRIVINRKNATYTYPPIIVEVHTWQ